MDSEHDEKLGTQADRISVQTPKVRRKPHWLLPALGMALGSIAIALGIAALVRATPDQPVPDPEREWAGAKLLFPAKWDGLPNWLPAPPEWPVFVGENRKPNEDLCPGDSFRWQTELVVRPGFEVPGLLRTTEELWSPSQRVLLDMTTVYLGVRPNGNSLWWVQSHGDGIGYLLPNPNLLVCEVEAVELDPERFRSDTPRVFSPDPRFQLYRDGPRVTWVPVVHHYWALTGGWATDIEITGPHLPTETSAIVGRTPHDPSYPLLAYSPDRTIVPTLRRLLELDPPSDE